MLVRVQQLFCLNFLYIMGTTMGLTLCVDSMSMHELRIQHSFDLTTNTATLNQEGTMVDKSLNRELETACEGSTSVHRILDEDLQTLSSQEP